VYAPTGPRIRLRFFGGGDFKQRDAHAPDLAAIGYASGVPMGGQLPARAREHAPRFLVHALKDPDGANLDRVQIVKAWLKADGSTNERVYDVAVSDGRQPDPHTGKFKDLRPTIDLEQASYTNSIDAVS